ncbi:family 78 glycoside hydrolase catalytic domain [Paenibacillus sp. OV219]|uniref:family 78 glycoside hydrolase catalytic domain n=1 Tax=Paenibacillus sp. OV219 TaxID=1884377 RepID=UPI0008BC5737|nr:family 78 glycoside hydrolase catalytic domain [Paenibacillus sp. OV219]SEM51493.1 Alpha-L-rhamnosidase N-terminal domain-containing protein [Paenibacillus sp. OV219]
MWHASWIWGSGEESPRNAWRCFRNSFKYEAEGSSNTTVKLTADSRYVLYVNGVQVGRGPVRSWPFELAYDEYEIGHLLKAGSNTIAVLVLHYGVATFQYLRGRGGLLLQVASTAVEDGTERIIAATDSSWTTTVHDGYDARSSRISCQLAFAERYDARSVNDTWTEATFDDSTWESAVVIGNAGMAPWTSLVPRSIPYLTEEPIYPARVEELNFVKPAAWNGVFDVRTLLIPDSVNHANPTSFIGFMATIVTLSKAAAFTIGSVDNGRIPLRVSINGKWLDRADYYGESPQQFVTAELPAGEHFLLFDLSRGSHGHGYHLGLHADVPFEVRSPLAGSKSGNDETGAVSSSVPFAAIGAFDWAEHIDHQPESSMRKEQPEYDRMLGVGSAEQLLSDFSESVREVPEDLFTRTDVYGESVWHVVEQPQPVPVQLQQVVLASGNTGVVPVHAELDTELVIDFGRELSGFIAFEVDAAEGTVIDGYGFEFMRDGWRQHTYELDNTFRYTCREGRQSYVSVVRRGLRYLAITVRGASRPVKLVEVKLLQSNFPVANVGVFQSSNAMLNEIWRISRDSTRLCMEDTFVDCPAFEQTYWVGDARNASLINYYAFGDADIVERCLRLVPGSTFQSPLYGDQVPSGWSSVIPNWTFFWVTACLEHYQYTGNEQFARDMWPHVRFTLEHYLKHIDERGLFCKRGWNLLDWANFEQPGDGVVSPQNMFLVKSLRDAAALASAAGDEAGGSDLLEQASMLRSAINAQLWDADRAAYLDCIHIDGRPSETVSMQTQVIAMLCDIAEGERAEVLDRYVVEPPAHFVQIGSPFMSFFYYEALAKLGHQDTMTADILHQYGAMVDNGATSVWEVYPTSGITHNPKMLTRSHCHAWSAGPAFFLGAEVLGVRGASPGWTKVSIAPKPVGLSWARGSVPMPGSGRIDVSWSLDTAANVMKLRVVAPKHVELAYEQPEGYELAIDEVRIG